MRQPLLRRSALRGDSAPSSTALVLAIAHFKVCIAPLHTSQVLDEVRMPVKVQYLVSPGTAVRFMPGAEVGPVQYSEITLAQRLPRPLVVRGNAALSRRTRNANYLSRFQKPNHMAQRGGRVGAASTVLLLLPVIHSAPRRPGWAARVRFKPWDATSCFFRSFETPKRCAEIQLDLVMDHQIQLNLPEICRFWTFFGSKGPINDEALDGGGAGRGG